MSKLNTASYKGVRDFYPEDQFIQNHIFNTWRKTADSFGYTEYGASILEPTELYTEKTGQEIVSEQTYSFTDRGDRQVTLRPELTPTTARMVAARRRELTLPLRWYSIPNLFRYESPQRGRLREHWQLNVDLFGVKSTAAEAEVIEVAYRIMRNFGAEDNDFIIRLNSRRIVDRLYSLFDVSPADAHKLSKLIDKKAKVSETEFTHGVEEVLGGESGKFIDLLNSPEKLLEKLGKESEEVREVLETSEQLSQLGITNITFDLTLMRGFDYYTGVVFEIFDTHPENNRSLFGGGRYDELLNLFDEEPIAAFGFGTGDVTMRDFLETRNLLPKYQSPAMVAVLPLESKFILDASKLADELRKSSINTCVDSTDRKIGDKIKAADKQGVKYALVIGEDEAESKTYKLKNLETGEEKEGPTELLLLEIRKDTEAK